MFYYSTVHVAQENFKGGVMTQIDVLNKKLSKAMGDYSDFLSIYEKDKSDFNLQCAEIAGAYMDSIQKEIMQLLLTR